MADRKDTACPHRIPKDKADVKGKCTRHFLPLVIELSYFKPFI